jgi:hypothetical protein
MKRKYKFNIQKKRRKTRRIVQRQIQIEILDKIVLHDKDDDDKIIEIDFDEPIDEILL